jgi:hypothetical protein
MISTDELIALRTSARFILDTCESRDVGSHRRDIVKEAENILARLNQEIEEAVNAAHNKNSDETYYVWSAEHRAWWGPGGRGYSRGLNQAGLYERDHALEICRSAIPTSGGLGTMSEMPVRSADVAEFLKGQMIPGPLLNGDRR